MTKSKEAGPGSRVILDEVRRHLLQAQAILEEVKPSSVFAARLQHLIDDMLDGYEADTRGRSDATV